ncbi:MAG: hypothetical protein IKO63_05820 [Paludibacteraceae bacterium]|nr:hypothetical protein [Paludibacteraceae bacterium]
MRAEYVVVGYASGSAQEAEATIRFPKGVLGDIGTITTTITPLRFPFSVGAGKTVVFTAGNLRYLASTNTWQIAEHQYDMIGYRAGNTEFDNAAREIQSDTIDMFPFGCSGWNPSVSGVKYYQPWNSGKKKANGDENATGFLKLSLINDKVEADWAYHNAIYNPLSGANTAEHTFRVLTDAEWTYLLNNDSKGRPQAKYLYGQACIKISTDPDVCVNGLVILPDTCSTFYNTLKIHDDTPWSSAHNSYTDNVFTVDQWTDFEANYGAVFLPAAGAYENGASDGGKDGAKHEPGKFGLYWTTTFNSGNKARYMGFKSNGIHYADKINSPLEAVRRVDNCLAVRAVMDYNYPGYACTNCKDVTLTPPTPPETTWTVTINPGVGYHTEDVTWDDDATNHNLVRTYIHNPANEVILHVNFVKKKPIYASTDDLLPQYMPDALARGTVALDSDDPSVWPKTITATPAPGFVFIRWDDGVVTNPRTISSIEEAARKGYYTAHFAPTTTSGNFIVDSHLFSWTQDSVYIRTDAQDLQDVAAVMEVTFSTGEAVKGSKDDFDLGIYTIPTGDLSDKEGATMNIVFLDKCGNIVTHALGITVPKIVKANANASALSLSATSDVVVLSGVTLTFNTNATINSLTVQAGAKVEVQSGKTLTTSSITMSADAITGEEGIYPQLLVNGNILKKGDTSNPVPLYLDYALDYQKYYPLMLPYNVDIANITFADGTPATIDEDYEIHRYNGTYRAAGGSGWENVGDDSPAATTLLASQGYDIFAAQAWKDPDNYRRRAILRFPMLADLSAGETAKSFPVSLYSSSHPDLANWNLIGNPYLSSFHELDGDADAIALIAEVDDEETGNKVRYLTIPENGFRNYNQVLVEDADVSPFNVFFIQAAEEADLTIAVTDRYLKAPARQIAEDTELPKELKAGVILTQGNRSDRTGILLGNAFTEEYDYNADLAKLFGTSDRLNVYSVIGNTQLAYCALPYAADGNGQIMHSALSIGYRNVSTENQATFAFDYKRYKSDALEALYLTDNYTGQTIDLLVEDYVFSPLKAQDDERFVLSAQPRRVQEITTGLDATTSVPAGKANGVYDLLGRKICNSADCFNRIKGCIPAGVYVIIDNGQLMKEVVR